MKIMTKFDFPAGKPLNMRQKTGFLSSGVNGRTSGVGTRGFARDIERKAQIKPKVFNIPILKNRIERVVCSTNNPSGDLVIDV
jgi:hypothetical protein